MSEQQQVPEANVKPLKNISKVWFIPIVAFFIGIWMVYYSWSNQGPLIVIKFQTAEGIEVDTTKLQVECNVTSRFVFEN